MGLLSLSLEDMLFLCAGDNHPVLPLGMNDAAGVERTMSYCPRCGQATSRRPVRVRESGFHCDLNFMGFLRGPAGLSALEPVRGPRRRLASCASLVCGIPDVNLKQQTGSRRVSLFHSLSRLCDFFSSRELCNARAPSPRLMRTLFPS